MTDHERDIGRGSGAPGAVTPASGRPAPSEDAVPHGSQRPPPADAAALAQEVRALRDDVTELREVLGQRSGRAADSEDRDRLARELADARERLASAQRELQRSEAQRRRMLRSRTWRWGKATTRAALLPVNAARAVYAWLLAALPDSAGAALRRLVATVKGAFAPPSGPAAPPARQPPADPSQRAGSASAPVTGTGMVPIPALHAQRGAAATPGVLVVVYGADAEAMEAVVEEIDAIARRVSGLRVLVVTDCDAFHVFRARNLLFEYVPPRAQWEEHGFAQSYDEFRALRMGELIDVYAPDRLVHVSDVDDLRGLPISLFTS